MSGELVGESPLQRPTLAGWYGYGQKSDANGHAGARSDGPKLPPIGAERLISAWLDGLSEETINHYRSDMEIFARFIGAPNGADAGKHLMSLSNGEANLLALEFRNHMAKQGHASASVNRRLAALRSFTKAARKVGLIPWVLEVDRLPAQPYRDTRGPGHDGFKAMLDELAKRDDAKAARDIAIIRLLGERGLRSKEVAGLDVADVDLEKGAVFILGKMRREKEWVGLAPPTTEALKRWLDVRGTDAGPLWVRFQHAYGAGRLSRQGLYRMVRELGDAVGVRARPHGLRHSAITQALDAGLDVRSVQRFSRHKNLNTLLIYDDNRQDLGREVSAAIAVPMRGSAQPAPKPVVAAPVGSATTAIVRVGKPALTPHQRGLRRGEASANAKVTEADVLEIRRRHAAGEGPTALCEAFGLGAGTLRAIITRQSWKHIGGEPVRRQKRKAVQLTDADVLEIRRRRKAGEVASAIAEHFRITEGHVYNIEKRRSHAHVVDPMEEKAPPKYERLTGADVVEMRRRHAAGETLTSLADAFGVDRNHVSNIVRGKAWKDLGGDQNAEPLRASSGTTPLRYLP